MNEPVPKAGKDQLQRPDPQDIIHSELNLERWPGLWATRDSDEKRSLTRNVNYPDGSKFKATLHVEAPVGTGTLTTETLKYYSVILKLRQDLWGASGENTPPDRRLNFTLRTANRLLHPGTTRDQRWGSTPLASGKRHLRKLARVNLTFDGAFWDAQAHRKRRFEGGFTIISDYLLAEERRFNKGQIVQLPLELGYVRLNPWIEDNLDQHFTAPVYFSERIAIKAPFASQLYNHLNIMMAGQRRYQRRLDALFEEDFPDMASKYPAPSQRKRVLERNLKELRGRKITTGVLTSLTIKKTTDGKQWKLIVSKEAFPKELSSPSSNSQSETKPASSTPAPSANLSPAVLRRKVLVEDILEVTCDQQSEGFYHLVAKHVPEDVVRRLIAEIRADFQQGIEIRNRGALFTSKVQAFCQERGVPLFWKTKGH